MYRKNVGVEVTDFWRMKLVYILIEIFQDCSEVHEQWMAHNEHLPFRPNFLFQSA